jgi:hypothetical protein
VNIAEIELSAPAPKKQNLSQETSHQSSSGHQMKARKNLDATRLIEFVEGKEHVHREAQILRVLQGWYGNGSCGMFPLFQIPIVW